MFVFEIHFFLCLFFYSLNIKYLNALKCTLWSLRPFKALFLSAVCSSADIAIKNWLKSTEAACLFDQQ